MANYIRVGRVPRAVAQLGAASRGAARRGRMDAAATTKAVAAIIASRTADEWAPVLAADCCVTIVTDLEHAVADPHFTGRAA